MSSVPKQFTRIAGVRPRRSWFPRNAIFIQETGRKPASLLDQALGRGSAFARRHGFYVDVVVPEIATLPKGWQSRLKAFRVGQTTAFCLEIHDLLISKLAAGRLKDLEFVGALMGFDMANLTLLRRRIGQLELAKDRGSVRSRLKVVLNDMNPN